MAPVLVQKALSLTLMLADTAGVMLTLAPMRAMLRAAVMQTVDFPTPPLELATAMALRTSGMTLAPSGSVRGICNSATS